MESLAALIPSSDRLADCGTTAIGDVRIVGSSECERPHPWGLREAAKIGTKPPSRSAVSNVATDSLCGKDFVPAVLSAVGAVLAASVFKRAPTSWVD